MANKVAIITPVFPPYRGGIGNVAYHHARLLAERGCEVTVFTPAYAKASAGRPDYDFSIEFIKPVLKYGNAAWVSGLKDKLKDFHTVILHYPFFGGMKAVLQAKQKYKFKLIVYYHMDVVGNGLKGLVFWYATRYFLPRLVKHADIVLASSVDYARHSNLAKYWQASEKFKVLPIGVDVSRFSFFDVARERMILFVGGLDKAHYFKGVEYLIRAATSVRAEDFKVVIAGKGELMAQYQKLAENLGLADTVEFAGGVSDEELVKLYQRACVTVLPSIDKSEAFGIVLVESMACGTPVIASDLPGVRSVFENNISGFIVLSGDTQALAERIQYALENTEKMKEMGLAGRRLVEEKYHWETIGSSLQNLL